MESQTKAVSMDSVWAGAGFHYILTSFQGFSQKFVENSVRVLVTRFLRLNASDLENWMSDPEEWVSTEEKENARWEFEIRVCMFFSGFHEVDKFERHALNTSSCN